MRYLALSFCVLALLGLDACGGCSKKKEAKDASVKETKQVPPADAGVAKRVLPLHKPNHVPPPVVPQAHPGQAKVKVKIPDVTDEEIENDPLLRDTNLPYATKVILKRAKKVQIQNPNLTRPDDWYKAEPDGDKPPKNGQTRHPKNP